jgi:hypothetical protein
VMTCLSHFPCSGIGLCIRRRNSPLISLSFAFMRSRRVFRWIMKDPRRDLPQIRVNPKKLKSTFQLGPHEALLWTQGNLPAVAKGKDYYKEGKGTPEPLLLVRHAGLGSIDDLCRETLALTKMDWNNDGPYDRLPVTLNFAGTLEADAETSAALISRALVHVVNWTISLKKPTVVDCIGASIAVCRILCGAQGRHRDQLGDLAKVLGGCCENERITRTVWTS